MASVGFDGRSELDHLAPGRNRLCVTAEILLLPVPDAGLDALPGAATTPPAPASVGSNWSWLSLELTSGARAGVGGLRPRAQRDCAARNACSRAVAGRAITSRGSPSSAITP